MQMQANYLDAHERHLSDAERLFAAQRWANADHLYGLAAECGLKRLMRAFGMPFDSKMDRPQEKNDRVHANGIWERFESYRSGHQNGTAYALPEESPFANWHINERYAHQSHFELSRVEHHQKGALMVAGLITKAKHEGLLP